MSLWIASTNQNKYHKQILINLCFIAFCIFLSVLFLVIYCATTTTIRTRGYSVTMNILYITYTFTNALWLYYYMTNFVVVSFYYYTLNQSFLLTTFNVLQKFWAFCAKFEINFIFFNIINRFKRKKYAFFFSRPVWLARTKQPTGVNERKKQKLLSKTNAMTVTFNKLRLIKWKKNEKSYIKQSRNEKITKLTNKRQ